MRCSGPLWGAFGVRSAAVRSGCGRPDTRTPPTLDLISQASWSTMPFTGRPVLLARLSTTPPTAGLPGPWLKTHATALHLRFPGCVSRSESPSPMSFFVPALTGVCNSPTECPVSHRASTPLSNNHRAALLQGAACVSTRATRPRRTATRITTTFQISPWAVQAHRQRGGPPWAHP